jgi:hypothetical protein
MWRGAGIGFEEKNQRRIRDDVGKERVEAQRAGELLRFYSLHLRSLHHGRRTD